MCQVISTDASSTGRFHALVLHIQDGCAVDCALVARLPASLREEHGVVEDNMEVSVTSRSARLHRCRKRPQGGVPMVSVEHPGGVPLDADDPPRVHVGLPSGVARETAAAVQGTTSRVCAGEQQDDCGCHSRPCTLHESREKQRCGAALVWQPARPVTRIRSGGRRVTVIGRAVEKQPTSRVSSTRVEVQHGVGRLRCTRCGAAS